MFHSLSAVYAQSTVIRVVHSSHVGFGGRFPAQEVAEEPPGTGCSR